MRATTRFAWAVLLITLGASLSQATPPSPPPLPPELQFASDSLEPVMRDSSRALWVLQKLHPIEAKFPGNSVTPQIKFWALISSRAPVSELTAATDTLIAIFGAWERFGVDHRGSQTQAHQCLDLVGALLARQEALTTAERYARQAVKFAAFPHTWLYGYSMQVLAQVQRAEGMRDSAVVTLQRAISGLPEHQQPLLNNLRQSLDTLLNRLDMPPEEHNPGLRLRAEIHRKGSADPTRAPDTTTVLVFITNESPRRVSGTFTLDIEGQYAPSNATISRLDAQAEFVKRAGGRVCRRTPVLVSIPKWMMPNGVFLGDRVSMRPGGAWVDSVDVTMSGAGFIDFPGSFVGRVSLWSGKSGASWSKAQRIASVPITMPIP